MSINKSNISGIVIIILIMAILPSDAGERWQHWNNLRWSGLQAFKKGQNESARKIFEQELAEAERLQPNSKQEIISIYDLAQVYDVENQDQKAEVYCKRALALARRFCSNESGIVSLILNSLADLKSKARKYDEVGKIMDENDKDPSAGPVGVATMETDGTINLHMYGPGDVILHYYENEPDYKATLMHIGPLQPGGSRPAAPWINGK